MVVLLQLASITQLLILAGTFPLTYASTIAPSSSGTCGVSRACFLRWQNILYVFGREQLPSNPALYIQSRAPKAISCAHVGAHQWDLCHIHTLLPAVLYHAWEGLGQWQLFFGQWLCRGRTLEPYNCWGVSARYQLPPYYVKLDEINHLFPSEITSSCSPCNHGCYFFKFIYLLSDGFVQQWCEHAVDRFLVDIVARSLIFDLQDELLAGIAWQRTHGVVCIQNIFISRARICAT